MQELCESHAAYAYGVVSGVSCGLGSRLLISLSAVDHSSEGDDQPTCQFIVIRASTIVQIDIISKCAFSISSECSSEYSSECSSKMQSPVLCAVEVPKHRRGSNHMLISQVIIELVEKSDGICDSGPSGGHRVPEVSDQRLV